MQAIQIRYRVSISDFRKASYYALAWQKKKTLKAMGIILAAALLYYVLQLSKIVAENAFICFFALGYFLWGLLTFSGVERGLKKYINSDGSMLGKEFIAILGSKDICFRIPEEAIEHTFLLHQLYCVFELSELLLFYITEAEVYIVPKRDIREEELAAIRKTLNTALADKFCSRFVKD